MNDAIHDLVERAMSTSWRDLPARTRTRARWAVADTLATAVAGQDAEGVGAVRQQLLHWGGRPEATTVGWGDRLPAPAAAWLNAMMGRALDFDDCDDDTGDHPSVATVSAALAAAESTGRDDVEAVLAGVVAGTEVVCRLRRATDERLNPDLPWTAGTYAPMAAAIAAARTLDVEVEQAVSAAGIAFTEMSNTIQSQRDGTLAHRVHHGSAVASGLAAVAFAERGISGVRNVLEGPFGVFRSLMNGRATAEQLMAGGPDPEPMLDRVSVKPYPCCRFTHGPIEAVLRLAGGEPVDPARVTAVEVAVGKPGIELCGAPWQRGASAVAAQFNLQFAVATALLDGGMSLAHFGPGHRDSAAVAEVAARVRVTHDPALDIPGTQVGPCAVRLQLDRGRVASLEVPAPYGHPRNPISDRDFVAKLRDCVATGRTPAQAQAAGDSLVAFVHGDGDGVLHLLEAVRNDREPAAVR